MTIFKNGKIILKDKILENYFIAVDDGIIIDIYDNEKKYSGDFIDAQGMYISPGFIDMHVHGGGGGDFMDGDDEAIKKVLNLHTSHGTTSMFPTTLSASIEETVLGIKKIENFEYDKPYCEILGIHLEGPFLNISQAGAQDPKYIMLPTQENYEPLLSSKLVTRVTMSPEIDGALDFCKLLKNKNIKCSIGHTAASYDEVVEGFKVGANHATHFYSGMSIVHRVNGYRKVGVVESVYLIDDMTLEVIADGKHLPPELLKLIYKIKGPDKIALVTDAMRGAGQTSGQSILGSPTKGQPVVIRDGVAFLPDGNSFAGSVATTDRLVRTMINEADVSIVNAVKMASLTPAIINNVEKQKGSIEVGKDADLIIFDKNVKIKFVMTNGLEFLNQL